MSKVLLIPVASPLHNPFLVGKVLNLYQKKLDKIIDSSLSLIIKGEDLEKLEIDKNVLGIIAPLTGGTEHIIQHISEKCGFTLLVPHTSMNSLPAALEAFSKIKNAGRSWIILEWPPGKRVQKFAKAWRTISEIKKMKIGLIGEPSPWLVYSSGEDVEKNINVLFEELEILRIDVSEVYQEFSKISEIDVDVLKRELIKKTKAIRIPEDEVAKSLKIHLSLKKIIEKYGLDAVTVRCFNIITDLDTTACLSASLLNSKVSMFGCEGDIPALLTMIIFSKLAEAPSFMGNINWIQDTTITIAHCTAPLTIAEKFELDNHFESGRGVGVRCYVPENREATLGRLDPVSRVIRYVVGRTIKKPVQEKACRTQLNIKIRSKDKSKLAQIVEESIGNHYVVVFKDISEELGYLARIMGIRLERI
ncbi:MAG: hypothetical protein QXL40_01680 [Nitrososphaerota archaeon]|nr:hypothetical protein [Candidatus Geocrenenecus dongiae]